MSEIKTSPSPASGPAPTAAAPAGDRPTAQGDDFQRILALLSGQGNPLATSLRPGKAPPLSGNIPPGEGGMEKDGQAMLETPPLPVDGESGAMGGETAPVSSLEELAALLDLPPGAVQEGGDSDPVGKGAGETSEIPFEAFPPPTDQRPFTEVKNPVQPPLDTANDASPEDTPGLAHEPQTVPLVRPPSRPSPGSVGESPPETRVKASPPRDQEAAQRGLPPALSEDEKGVDGAGENPGRDLSGDGRRDHPATLLTQLAGRFQALRGEGASTPPAPDPAADPGALDAALDPALDGLDGGAPDPARPGQTWRLTLPTPLQDPRWGRDFSERILWLTRGDQGAAELRLNPRHLGPIQVRIQLEDDQATLHIQAHHATTREAVEAALPRLRESLAEAGIQLVGAQIQGQNGDNGSGGRFRDTSPQAGSEGRSQGGAGDGGDEAPAAGSVEAVLASDGLLDTFV